MIKLLQIENENPILDLWSVSNPKRASYYVDTETNRAVDNLIFFLASRIFRRLKNISKNTTKFTRSGNANLKKI